MKIITVMAITWCISACIGCTVLSMHPVLCDSKVCDTQAQEYYNSGFSAGYKYHNITINEGVKVFIRGINEQRGGKYQIDLDNETFYKYNYGIGYSSGYEKYASEQFKTG